MAQADSSITTDLPSAPTPAFVRIAKTYGWLRTEIRIGRAKQAYRMPAFEALGLARHYNNMMPVEGGAL